MVCLHRVARIARRLGQARGKRLTCTKIMENQSWLQELSTFRAALEVEAWDCIKRALLRGGFRGHGPETNIWPPGHGHNGAGIRGLTTMMRCEPCELVFLHILQISIEFSLGHGNGRNSYDHTRRFCRFPALEFHDSVRPVTMALLRPHGQA